MPLAGVAGYHMPARGPATAPLTCHVLSRCCCGPMLVRPVTRNVDLIFVPIPGAELLKAMAFLSKEQERDRCVFSDP
jgi:hypothetical protein